MKPIIITGPTATGKTEMGYILAKRLNGEIISADSKQIYKGCIIGTSSPINPPVPYHLINFLEPTERYDAMRFIQDSEKLIDDITSRGKLPIIVGGTGFYIRALTEGLFIGDTKDSEIRNKLKKRYEQGENLWDELNRIDSESANKIEPNDYYRIERALEVFYKTGTPLSQWKKRKHHKVGDYSKFILMMDRAELYRRIESRVDSMIAEGWINEVRELIDSGISPNSPAFESVGYMELYRYIKGEISLDEAIDRIKTRTRQYAKRQITWFNKEPNCVQIDISRMDTEEIAERVMEYLAI